MRLLLATALFLAAGTASAQTPPAVWPHAEDIPRPLPVSVPLAGAERPDITRFLLASGPTGAELSADGRTLMYLSSITGQPQVWVMDAAGGVPRQLTFGLGVDGASWAPDGSAIIYGADKGGDERYGLFAVTPDGRREVAVVPQSDAFTFPGDFTNDGRRLFYTTTARNGRDFDVWSAALDGSGQTEVVQGRLGLYPGPVQPNGSLMILSEARGENGTDISLLDLSTATERSLFKPAETALHASFQWMPDGSGFYFTSDDGREHIGLARYDLASGRTTWVETPDRDVEAVELSHDGRWLVWRTDDGGVHRLHARDLTTGRDVPTPDLPSGLYNVDFAERASVALIHVNGPTTPGELWVWDVQSGAARRVVEANLAGLDPAGLVEPEVVRFAARDGVPLGGLLYRPRGATGPTPVFLRLHGGPTSHARANWKADMQYLVSRGIAVLDFNYRGSTGYGKAGTLLNDRRLRVNEIGDLVDAVAWIRAQPGLDGDKVAVGGASYGGYLTNAVLGAYPELFVAGVSEVGVADWLINLEQAAPSLQASDRVEYGDYRDPSDRAFLASLSPMNNAARIRRPLMVQVGANDPRNGASEQDRFVQAIRDAGGSVLYRRYEGEGHVMTDLPNIIDFNRAKAAFLEEHFAR